MLFCNFLIFYNQGPALVYNYVNYEINSLKNTLSNNEVHEFYSRYSSLISQNYFSGIYSKFLEISTNKYQENSNFIIPNSITNDSYFFWFPYKKNYLGFYWNYKEPLYVNIGSFANVANEESSDYNSGSWRFFVLKKYSIIINLLMLIPDLIILIFGIQYHLRLKKSHRDFIDQFDIIRKIFKISFNKEQSYFVNEFKFNKNKSEKIIEDFMELRNIAYENAKDYHNSLMMVKEYNSLKSTLEIQKQVFVNINRTNHDFSKILDMNVQNLKIKIDSKKKITFEEMSAMYRQIYFCNSLVKSFKDLATPLVGRIRELDNEELFSYLDISFNKIADKKIRVIKNYNNNLIIKADDGFGRVFVNILSNAIERMPISSSLIIDCKIIGKEIIYNIKNTGTSVEKNELVKILQPFNKLDNVIFQSCGNGLTIAKEIVEAHQGTLIADSSGSNSEEKWFAVNITLPIDRVICTE